MNGMAVLGRTVRSVALLTAGLLIATGAMARSPAKPIARPIKVMTFNVRYASDEGATRWSATWIDANLPEASHGMTVETLIVPLSGDWVLELSLSGIETREAYDALARHLLARLKVQGRVSCRG